MTRPLLAERDVADLLQSAEFLWLVGALIGVLLLGAILISWVERWRKRQLADSPATDVNQFATYRAMFERGELTQEEYDRIKRKEAHRLRDKLAPKPAVEPGTKAPPAQPAPQEPGAPPPPLD